MSKMFDENGNEVEGFTAEEMAAKEKAVKDEYEAKLKDKDTHVNTKLDEFAKAKAIQDAKDAERDAKIAAAQTAAETATAAATTSETKRLAAIKENAMKKFTGDNAELRAKFDEAWQLVVVEIKDDTDIFKKAEMVANMAGLNQGPVNYGEVDLSGGRAPNLSPAEKQKKDADHAQFMNAIPGLNDFIPKPEENK